MPSATVTPSTPVMHLDGPLARWIAVRPPIPAYALHGAELRPALAVSCLPKCASLHERICTCIQGAVCALNATAVHAADARV